MKAVIVGGSIGGLSAAAALLNNGFEDIVVLERAAKIIPAGAVRQCNTRDRTTHSLESYIVCDWSQMGLV
jgi:2-polyprenyl-6-methoxyphenol hydroxylase-like FAD-dependent oxidoreductase